MVQKSTVSIEVNLQELLQPVLEALNKTARTLEGISFQFKQFEGGREVNLQLYDLANQGTFIIRASDSETIILEPEDRKALLSDLQTIPRKIELSL